MKICVGSGNPVKLAAISEVMRERFEDAEFLPCAVSSGVPDQPIGYEQTIGGAINRARAAYALEDGCDLAVALESGLIPVPLTRTGYMNLTACVIFDGTYEYIGLGPAFELPDDVARLVTQEGMELDPAVRQAGLTDNPRIGYSQGLIGILSQGRVTRADYSRPAVSMALVRMGL